MHITENHIQSIILLTSDHLHGYIILWLDQKTGKSEITFLFLNLSNFFKFEIVEYIFADSKKFF
jgi:hypothetical protein